MTSRSAPFATSRSSILTFALSIGKNPAMSLLSRAPAGSSNRTLCVTTQDAGFSTATVEPPATGLTNSSIVINASALDENGVGFPAPAGPSANTRWRFASCVTLRS